MIIGIGGNLSGGKTITAVKLCYDQRKEKRIISNITLNFENTLKINSEDLINFLKTNYDNPIKLKSFFQNSILFLDEISLYINARRFNTQLNELFNGFFMMTGKMNTDIIFTYQVKSSMIDKILRDTTNVWISCYRVNKDGMRILGGNRILNEEILIYAVIEIELENGINTSVMIFDPTPYYHLYDTQDILMLDRSKYLRGGSHDLKR